MCCVGMMVMVVTQHVSNYPPVFTDNYQMIASSRHLASHDLPREADRETDSQQSALGRFIIGYNYNWPCLEQETEM